MAEIFFSSDMHLYHRRIQEFCPSTRFGNDENDMSERIFHNLSVTIKPGDILWNLGDFCFRSKEHVEKSLKRIKSMGIVHNLILGNHDKHIRNDPNLQGLLNSVQDLKCTYIEKQIVVMCHFPIARWESSGNASFMLHGHTHGDYQGSGRIMDVGIDTRNPADMMPYHFEEVKRFMKSRHSIDHHERDSL